MSVTTSPISTPANVEHEDLLVLHLLPSDLQPTRKSAALRGTDFVGVLQQQGLGSPSYFAGDYANGKAYDRVLLSYATDGRTFERVWNSSRVVGDTVTYTLRGDGSSHGYISDPSK